jgi:hypothetical protein
MELTGIAKMNRIKTEKGKDDVALPLLFYPDNLCPALLISSGHKLNHYSLDSPLATWSTTPV